MCIYMNYQQVYIAEVHTFHFCTRVTSFNNTVLAESLAISFLCVHGRLHAFDHTGGIAVRCMQSSCSRVECGGTPSTVWPSITAAPAPPPRPPPSTPPMTPSSQPPPSTTTKTKPPPPSEQQQQISSFRFWNYSDYITSTSEGSLPRKKHPFFWALPKLGGPTCPNWRWHFLFVEQKQK